MSCLACFILDFLLESCFAIFDQNFAKKKRGTKFSFLQTSSYFDRSMFFWHRAAEKRPQKFAPRVLLVVDWVHIQLHQGSRHVWILDLLQEFSQLWIKCIYPILQQGSRHICFKQYPLWMVIEKGGVPSGLHLLWLQHFYGTFFG